MSQLIEEAFRRLYPNREYNYNAKLRYSGHFSDYNANIKLSGFCNLTINLSKKWKGVNHEIVVGLIQVLLLKLFGGKKVADKSTLNIKLYNSFIKNLHHSIPKNNINSLLKRSFDRVNERFFHNQIETSNLIWGNFTKRKLGSYNFQNDTISINKVFQNTEVELLDYVMYHEMLHKKFKFSNNNRRILYHSKQFREAERLFPNSELLEKRLKCLHIRDKQQKRSIFGWFS